MPRHLLRPWAGPSHPIVLLLRGPVSVLRGKSCHRLAVPRGRLVRGSAVLNAHRFLHCPANSASLYSGAFAYFRPCASTTIPTRCRMRNPAWVRDEEILLLDVYLRFRPNSSTHPAVLQLSEVLRHLPLHPPSSRDVTFRNPAGVLMKLRNLSHLDPGHEGRGLERGSSLSQRIWDEFAHDAARLHRTATAIRQAVATGDGAALAASSFEGEQMALECRLLYRLHCARERSGRLVAAKKRQVLSSVGRLQCEVCGFDFEKTYGILGAGYMECHHILPLHELPGVGQVRLSDLALVCANCHRIVHRSGLTRTLDEVAAAICAGDTCQPLGGER